VLLVTGLFSVSGLFAAPTEEGVLLQYSSRLDYRELAEIACFGNFCPFLLVKILAH